VEVTPDQRETAVAEEGLSDDEPDDVRGGQAALTLALRAGPLKDRKDSSDGQQAIQRGKKAEVGIDDWG
jgi:hypothetical protein